MEGPLTDVSHLPSPNDCFYVVTQRKADISFGYYAFFLI
jgi:hypothetical protein